MLILDSTLLWSWSLQGTLTMKSNITLSQLLLALLKLLISSYQPDMATCNLNNAF